MHANHQWLASTGATYFWYHDIPRLEGIEWKRFQIRMAPILNPATISDFYAVKFESGDLSDDKLARIDKLTEVRLLTVASNAATDKTLARMATLHQLQGLTLKGKQFTFEGLLQLRRLPRLRELSLQDVTLSMAELAVLESAIPQATLKYNGSDALGGYRRQVFAHYPVTEPAPAAPEYGFEPLFSTDSPAADAFPKPTSTGAVETVDNRIDESPVHAVGNV